MKVFTLLCFFGVLLLLILPTNQGNVPLPNNDEWKNILGNVPLPNNDEWKNILGNVPLPDNENQDDWKIFLNQPLPDNDNGWKDIFHDVFNSAPDPQDSTHGGGNGNSVEDIVNDIVNSVVLPNSKKTENDNKAKFFCNQLNTTSINDLELYLENETNLFIGASRNAENAYSQSQSSVKGFQISQRNRTTTRDTLVQLLNINSDSLSVFVISQHLISSLQGVCDQYNVSVTVLNSTIQTLTATLVQTRSQYFKNRLSSLLNHTIFDLESVQDEISGLLSNIDTSQLTLSTLLNLYNQTVANLNNQIGVCQDVVDRVSAGNFYGVEEILQNLLQNGSSTNGNIVDTFQIQLPQYSERIISCNGSLHLDDKVTVELILEVDHDNLTDDGIVEFETEIATIIRGLSVYTFETPGDNVAITKTVNHKKRDQSGNIIQTWEVTLNQSSTQTVNPGVNPFNIQVDPSQFSATALSNTNQWINNITKGGNFDDKLTDLRSSLQLITYASKSFLTQINTQYQNYKRCEDEINEEINSFSEPLLNNGQNGVDATIAVFGHLSAVLNSTKTALEYQLNQISGSLLEANLTVLQIQINLTLVLQQINSTNNPFVISQLQIQKEVFTVALTQALKTLAILQNSFNNGSALLLNLDNQLSSAQNETNEHIQCFQNGHFATMQEIRQDWRENKDTILEQFRSSFESLLNCTVDNDNINGLDDNQTASLSLQWTFHFNLSSGETVNSKIPLLKVVIQNVLFVQAIVPRNSIQVTVNPSGSKRSAGDLSAQATISSSSSSTSTANQPASITPIIIGCVVGGVILVVLIVIVVVVLRRKRDERV